MKKRTKKHNPSFSFDVGYHTMRFDVSPDGVVECGVYNGFIWILCFKDNALDVIANLRQAAAEIERMYFEQEGK